MLVVKPRSQGGGIFDVISKVANSALAKKAINSAIGKKIIEQATKENFKKAANSAIGQQLKKSIVSGIANASEKAVNSTLEKAGISSKPGVVAGVSEKAANSLLEKIGFSPDSTIKPTPPKIVPPKLSKRKRPLSRQKGKRRRKIGKGIILE